MNENKTYCGWKDSALTEKGLRHIRALAERLKEEKVDLIVSSDLDRTVTTSKAILEFHKAEYITTKELREMCFGIWEGMNYDEINHHYPTEAQRWQEDWKDYIIPEGESLRQMYERVTRYTEHLMHSYHGQTILIVTHGGSIRAMLAHLIGRGLEDYWRYKVVHGRITRIEILEGFPVLAELNA